MVRLLIVLQGDGDRKIVSKVTVDSLRKIASISLAATAALEKVIEPMLSTTPTTLGLSDSTYYLGDAKITRDEIAAIARTMERHAFEPENTRVRKRMDEKKVVYVILQASAQSNAALEDHLKGSAIPIMVLQQSDGDQQLNDATIRLERGDHRRRCPKSVNILSRPSASRPMTPKSVISWTLSRASLREA